MPFDATARQNGLKCGSSRLRPAIVPPICRPLNPSSSTARSISVIANSMFCNGTVAPSAQNRSERSDTACAKLSFCMRAASAPTLAGAQ